MANIKQQISDFRQSTPKHIQWLLLVAALIVVLILLTLILTGRKKTNQIIIGDDGNETLVSFKPDSLNWQKVDVGQNRTENVSIYATNDIKIIDMKLAKTVDGLHMVYGTCKNQEIVGPQQPCQFTVKYNPSAAADATEIILMVTWRPIDALSDSMDTTAEFKLKLGAVVSENSAPVEKQKNTPAKPQESTPAPVPAVEPVKAKEPAPLPVAVPADKPITVPDVTDTPVLPDVPPVTVPIAEEIKRDIEMISYNDPFAAGDIAKKTVNEPLLPAESCSDFAMPGYNSSGRQIGWIKPERGAYYFHPFADTDCDKPTGVYNPDNGIITDIKDNTKRIGTDAEHIGYAGIAAGKLPQLSNPAVKPRVTADNSGEYVSGGMSTVTLKPSEIDEETFIGSSEDMVFSSQPFDRRFILRQFKPIPATIVSEVRADPSIYADGAQNIQLPVRATVDRNVYADNGRTVILPAGTMMMGYVTGKIPGPYTAVGRMQIQWYQFILPNGVEFNFSGSNDPFSADSQGRVGVPGRGSTDYLEQFVMPMITAIVPAAVNMIAPIADRFVNQIDLDNNTVVQSGTVRSSELAKNEIITAWNQVAQKLMVDVMDNTTPPFSIAAGTRITVYSPSDLIVTCGAPGQGKKCAIADYSREKRRSFGSAGFKSDTYIDADDTSWIGQARSFRVTNYCNKDGTVKEQYDSVAKATQTGYDYTTLLMLCKSSQYQAINQAKYEALYQNQQDKSNSNSVASMGGLGSQTYNEQVLGLKYDNDTGAIKNPFVKEPKPAAEAEAPSIGCLDGTKPDANGCCTGETFTDMGEEGWNCCPADGGDCFPPIL